MWLEVLRFPNRYEIVRRLCSCYYCLYSVLTVKLRRHKLLYPISAHHLTYSTYKQGSIIRRVAPAAISYTYTFAGEAVERAISFVRAIVREYLSDAGTDKSASYDGRRIHIRIRRLSTHSFCSTHNNAPLIKSQKL